MVFPQPEKEYDQDTSDKETTPAFTVWIEHNGNVVPESVMKTAPTAFVSLKNMSFVKLDTNDNLFVFKYKSKIEHSLNSNNKDITAT